MPGRLTRSRPACCWCWSAARTRVAAVPDGAAQDATRWSRTSARSPRPATSTARSPQTGVVPDGDLRAAGRCHQPAAAGVLGGQGRRAARLRARAGRRRGRAGRARGDGLPLRGAQPRRRPARVRDRVLLGHLRPQPDRGRSATPTASRCAARRIGEFDVAGADPTRVLGLDQALSFLPAVALCDEDAQRAAHGVPVSVPTPPGGGGVVRLRDEHGLIALAGPDPASGALRTIVGFRG